MLLNAGEQQGKKNAKIIWCISKIKTLDQWNSIQVKYRTQFECRY